MRILKHGNTNRIGKCPTCNNTIMPNTKLDVEKTMKSMVTEKVKDELINIYECINTYIKSRSFTDTESIIINSILNITLQHIHCLDYLKF